MSKKVALVTGGNRGIGESIVKRFTREGYFVYFTYNNNAIKALQLQDELNTNTECAKAIKVSATNKDEYAVLLEIIRAEKKQLDLLVNNAGMTKDVLFARMTDQDWHEVMDTNLNFVFYMTKLALEFMLPQSSGCVINLTSVSGIKGAAGQCNYSASKAGIITLTKSLARELSSFNIRVNAIAPGFIETDMTKNISGADKRKILQSCLLKRFGKPEEIANVAAFLASDQASYIQGQVITVDGGVLL